MKNIRVKTKSGLDGWQGRLQDQYDNFDSFCHYSEMYGLAKRLGFSGPEAAWQYNPLVQGSNPDDYCMAIPQTAKVFIVMQGDYSWKIVEEETYKNPPDSMIANKGSIDYEGLTEILVSNIHLHELDELYKLLRSIWEELRRA